MILFRCNANPSVGFGHLVRCRALAAALCKAGESCVMVGPDHAYRGPDDDTLFEEWIPVLDWTTAEADAHTFARMADERGTRVAVLDDYRANEAFQRVIWEHGLRWLQFDSEKGEPIWADLLLNASPDLTENAYVPLMRHADTKLLFGPQYAVLREEFPPLHVPRSGEPVERALLTFGGGDDRGAVEFVLSALESSKPPLHLLILSGAHNPRLPAIREALSRCAPHQAELLVNPPDIATQFARCDLAVMAGGTSVYEAASCGLPMILLAIADNQIEQSRAWERTGAAIYLGELGQVPENELADAMNALMRDGERCARMTATGRQLVDGRGARRVAEAIVKRVRRSKGKA